MNCKHCEKPKKEHFKRKTRDPKTYEMVKKIYCTKSGKIEFQLENCCEVCGVETCKFPDGQYICGDCRYNQERRDAFPGEPDKW